MRTGTEAKGMPDLKLGVVKIETTLIHKAKIIANDRGVPLSTYLSGAVAAAITKDWPKILKKMVQDEQGEGRGR